MKRIKDAYTCIQSSLQVLTKNNYALIARLKNITVELCSQCIDAICDRLFLNDWWPFRPGATPFLREPRIENALIFS